jgi:ketosteroid isomerase-like protein
MTDRNELERTVQALYKARRDNDLDTFMTFFDPACSFRIVGNDRLVPMTQRVNGADSLRIAVQGFMDNWDFTKLDTISLHVDGDTVFAVRSGQVRYIPFNISKDTEFIDRFTFKNGLVTDLAEYVDTLEVAETIGLVTF